MGYYTLHKIRIINAYNTKKNLLLLLEKIKEVSGYIYEIVGTVIFDSSWDSGLGSKWYNCRSDMAIISQKLPELKIQVKGKGEDGKMWEYIYENGNEYERDCEDFSDIDEEPDFEEENENNQLSYYKEEMLDIIFEDNEEEQENNIINFKLKKNLEKLKDDLNMEGDNFEDFSIEFRLIYFFSCNIFKKINYLINIQLIFISFNH